MPFHLKNKDFCVVAEAFYDCIDDFNDFCKKASRDFGLRETDLAKYADKVLVITEEKVMKK